MKILFFDTETTGLPKKNVGVEHQPKLVQFGAIFGEYEIEGQEYEIIAEEEIDVIFDPGIHIPKQASDVHKITDEIAEKHGPFEDYAGELMKMTVEADLIVCHNIGFDSKLIFWEIERLKPNWNKRLDWQRMFLKKSKCTMEAGTEYCKIPGRFGNYKWARLSELHLKLFGEDFENAHNAFADIVATRKCFFELLKKGNISLK